MSLTVTDQFCGAGGSSIGAEGVEGTKLALAMNHWARAIETHQHNFPDAAHDCADISATDPRRYPSTDILLTSPECTNHSLAKGSSRKSTAPHLFETGPEALARIEAERSRATMWDVPRFAEFHNYRAIIVENVVEARQWSMFPAWWQAMELLGYEGQSVFVNSMFFPPTPQSRDRMYVVWTKQGTPKPDLNFHPWGMCASCEAIVDAVQSWKKPDKPWGRYRTQYLYRCPTCTGIVEPAYTPAFTAIDWSDLGQRIGDREKPLAPATIARIKAGLERYGPMPAAVQVNGNTFERHPENAIRYKPLDKALRTQTATERDALVHPFLMVQRSHQETSGMEEPISTIVASTIHHALVVPGGLIVRNNGEGAWATTPMDEPIRTLTTKGHQSLLVPYYKNGKAKPADEAMPTLTGLDRFALVMANRTNGVPKSVDEQLQTICTGNHHYLIVPTERGKDGPRKRTREVTEELPTQTARQTLGLLLTPGGDTRPVEEVFSTQRTTTRDGVIAPLEVQVDDCGFRMLQPPEIGAGMAFPSTYVVTGNKREQVKQYGNAVTPPVMRWLTGRVVEALRRSA